jgi:protocatechuate 3,4-dioxygenase beta subunit
MFRTARILPVATAVVATFGIAAGAAGAAGMQGTVRGELGAPLAGATVSVSGPMTAAKRTKADGTYTIQGLVDGSYTVRFSPPAGSPLQEEYFDDQPDAAHATPVAVRSGTWTRPIDATLTRPPATITGRVTDERTGDRIKNVVVQATGPSSVTATTGADGRYALGGLVPGSYTLRFSPPTGVNYIVEFYADAADEAHAAPITVGAGATRTADAQLARGAVLTGSVGDSSGHGIGGVGIEIAHGSDPPVGTGVTNASGSFRIVGIRQAPGELGVYAARFRRAGYVDEDAPGRYLRAGQTYTTNVVMHRTDELAILTGQVTKAGGTPLEDAVVTATDNAGVTQFGQTTTGPDGRYRLALRGGTYRVGFAGPEGAGYAEQGRSVTLAWSTTSTIDVQLVIGATLKGRVTDTLGVPLEDVLVVVRSYPSRMFGVYTYTAADGRYTLDRIPPGQYYVELGDSHHYHQWWNHQPTYTTATVLTLASGQTVTGIDASLTLFP